MNVIKTRNYGLDLLKIIACLLVIMSHCFHDFFQYNANSNYLIWSIFSSFFCTIYSYQNCFFISISAYNKSGVKFNICKLLKIILLTTFYSIITYLIIAYQTNQFSIKQLYISFFPIITNKYWYITAYCILIALSPFINYILDLNNKKSKYFVITMVILFIMLPTLFYYGPAGEYTWNSFVLITYYISVHYFYNNSTFKKLSTRKILLMIITLLIIIICLNTTFTYFFGKSLPYNVFHPFSRCCCILMLLSTILITELFSRMQFTSYSIKLISSYSISIYLLDGFSQYIIRKFFPNIICQYNLFSMLIYIIFVFVLCIIIDTIRRLVFGKIEKHLLTIFARLIKKITKTL